MGRPSYNEQLQWIVQRYREQGQSWPATARTIAAWAIRQRLWAPKRDPAIARCADDLSRAMRDVYITDPQGRRVRALHAARHEGDQMSLWADIQTAPREHMEIAVQNRRQGIVADCKQLKTDVDSYNENAKPATQLRLILDFTDDVRELEAMGIS